jgi:deoxycytidylate deaminase
MIVNAGIKKVIYSNEYRDSKGLDILRKFQIEVRQYPADDCLL